MNTMTPMTAGRATAQRGQLILKNSASLYLDRPLPLPRRLAGALPFADAPTDRADGALMLGLCALIVPAVAYSFAQIGSLVSGGALLHAIHALLP